MLHKTTLTLIIAILSLTILSATDVSGNVSGVWSTRQSPYNVIGDVVVAEGSNLIVQAGVEVVFTGNFQLTIYGLIQAIGTAADSVRFSGAAWNSIRLEDTTQTSIFNYCVITGANIGITGIYSSFELANSRIGNVATNAISILGENGLPTYITSSKIHNSGLAGIMLTSVYYVYIIGNEVTRCVSNLNWQAAIQYSVQVTSCEPPEDEFLPLIKDNHIHHNFRHGIVTWDITSGDRIKFAIENNIIEYNYYGIYPRQSSGLIHNNLIRNNYEVGDNTSGAGIAVAGNIGNISVEKNIITGNYTGLLFMENASANLANGENIIYNNIDESNANWSIYLYGSNANVDASGNYFHSNNPATIATTIFDQNDNASLGLVTFLPLLNGGLMTGSMTLGSAPEPVYYQFTFTDTQQITEPIVITTHRYHPDYQIVVPAGVYNVSVQVNDSNYTGEVQAVSIIENAITANVNFTISGESSNHDSSIIPKPAISVSLYPNPFTGQSARFDVKSETTQDITLELFNVKGQKITTIFSGKAGNQTVNYNFGGQLPTGVYLYRLTTNGYAITKKMVIIR